MAGTKESAPKDHRETVYHHIEGKTARVDMVGPGMDALDDA
jgi:hypothetical protein